MFEGVKGGTTMNGFIAIDDIKVIRGACSNVGDCSFDDGSLCDYKNVATNQLDWQVFRGLGPNPDTSPSFDHTLGDSVGNYKGYYAMIGNI